MPLFKLQPYLFYTSLKVILRHPLPDRYVSDPHQNHQTKAHQDVITRTRQTPTRPIAAIKSLVVIAMYNYEARDSQDVSFKKGDRMAVLDESEGDWLKVEHLITKEIGFIPGNFVAPELSVESEEFSEFGRNVSICAGACGTSFERSIFILYSKMIFKAFTSSGDDLGIHLTDLDATFV
ncbi:hypothetical protein NQ317_000164 [Molorchus minor]|uniref:SH3 domain-containing protein n=1 Tax=Molorchus minor TaxID=1323400 RepID=A0ABQ9J276_9CUCU|nr:hypothetical protein NQ317_000164 [Molorchus minor]